MTKPRAYYSFLLRMWQTQDGDSFVWQASLEQPGTGERRGFADVQDLFQFLTHQMALRSEHPAGEGQPAAETTETL
jgi:hypothetical protein